jgi:hypothetical protein
MNITRLILILLVWCGLIGAETYIITHSDAVYQVLPFNYFSGTYYKVSDVLYTNIADANKTIIYRENLLYSGWDWVTVTNAYAWYLYDVRVDGSESFENDVLDTSAWFYIGSTVIDHPTYPADGEENNIGPDEGHLYAFGEVPTPPLPPPISWTLLTDPSLPLTVSNVWEDNIPFLGLKLMTNSSLDLGSVFTREHINLNIFQIYSNSNMGKITVTNAGRVPVRNF